MKTDVSREITRGIASSMTYKDIARNIKNVSGVSMGRAKTIARTEGHRIQEASRSDAQHRAKNIGADVVKQWDSALDGKTRDTHRKLDGQIREIDDPFEVDGKKAMHPGEFGRPEEDINCRCRSNTRARWALSANETKHLGNVEEMSLSQKQAIADKLKVPVDELDKYSGQIVPIKAKDYEDFKRQYGEYWHYEGSDLQKEAEARIAGYKTKGKKNTGLAAKVGGTDVPEHDAPKLVKHVDFNDRKAVMQEITSFEKDAAKSPVELARVVTKNGDIYDCYGTKDRVFPDYDLKNNLKGAIMSHSHPITETLHTFSHDDLEMFMLHDLVVLRGCDERYTYEFTRNAEDIDDIDDPDISIEDLLTDTFYHFDMIRRAKENGIGYRRWKND